MTDFTNFCADRDIGPKETKGLQDDLDRVQRKMDMENDATNRAKIVHLLKKIMQLCDEVQKNHAQTKARIFSESGQPALMTNPRFVALTLVLKSALAPALQAEKKQKDDAARAQRTKENNEAVAAAEKAAEKARKALCDDAALTVPVLTMEEKRELLLTCSPEDPRDKFAQIWFEMWYTLLNARDAYVRNDR